MKKNEKESDRPKKRQKVITCEDNMPPSTQWDENDYSCAYDALFTIPFNIWAANPRNGRNYFKIPMNIFPCYTMDSNNI